MGSGPDAARTMRWMRSCRESQHKGDWILDADIRSFFDAVSQEWLIKFCGTSRRRPTHHPPDPEWLKQASWKNGIVTVSDKGTGQGSVISPLLANLYLHYVFDSG